MDPIQEILQESKTIAVVGLSNNPARPALGVASYLKKQGYKIIPVNPKEKEVLGEKAYPDLLAIPEPVDIVDIFRNPEAVPPIVEQAIQIKAKVVWMQPGAENWDAADKAEAAGLKTVVGMCMRAEHQTR
ncbi:MAG: CoA-binding protein [Anaerolineae bacterium]